MVRLLRVVLLVVIALTLVSLLLGIVSGSTGALEKIILAAGGLLIVAAASRVRSLGVPSSQVDPRSE